MEDDNQNSSIIALKIIMSLSLVLVFMDMLEVYFSYVSLKGFALEFSDVIFENCIKYHMLTQMVFTIFATMAGFSAFIMSAGLLISHEFFAKTALESFVNFNYNIFGPFLFSMSLFGFTFYDKVVYNCDRENYLIKYINFSTLLALLICFLISFFITFVYSFLEGYHIMLGSIRFNRSGYKFLGKMFWKYVFYRRRDELSRSNNAIDNQFRRLYIHQRSPNVNVQIQMNHLPNEGNNHLDMNINRNSANDINIEEHKENTQLSPDNHNVYSDNNLEEPLFEANAINLEEEHINAEDFTRINYNDTNMIDVSNNVRIQKYTNKYVKDILENYEDPGKSMNLRVSNADRHNEKRKNMSTFNNYIELGSRKDSDDLNLGDKNKLQFN